ncbi:MAG: galactofuranose transport system ATP-binding protein [Chloroflexota bacterium]|nr:galactofuranose transport system ATP-binding protein [Chloroflexota bacterium]
MSNSNGEIIRLEGICKNFPGVQALQDVDFCLKKGEIHALVGENGAGKSTLIKVITGVERCDEGSITYDGKETVIRSPQHAQNIGISTVYQEVNLCSNISVAENLLLGREPRKLGCCIDWKGMNNRAQAILQGLDVDIDVSQPLGSFSTAIQQIIAIARALEISLVKVLILDEPTSSLDAHESDLIFKVMRKLRESGVGIIFITHFLKQVYEVSDRITVLRNGKLVATHETKDLPTLQLISEMIGRSLAEYDEMKKSKYEVNHQKALLEARGLGRSGEVEPFDLDLHAGEVVGLAGLLGSGRTEVAKVLFGIDEPDSGSLTVNDEPIKKHSPFEMMMHGMALCPEDRKASGIVGDLTIRENIILAMQARLGWFKYLRKQKQYEIADKYIAMLNIATPSPDQLVKNLSGGNQQKVILARWLATNPKLLLLDEPTRGIDVGAKAEIQKLVINLAAEGMGCMFISSELEEVLRTSHRVVVMRDHEKVTELSGEVGEREIMQAMAGGE